MIKYLHLKKSEKIKIWYTLGIKVIVARNA